MAHHEIQTLADLAAAPVTLEHKLGTLKQQRGFGGVFLVQATIEIFGDTQIHSHRPVVPNQYHAQPGTHSGRRPGFASFAGDERSIMSAANYAELRLCLEPAAISRTGRAS
jgi:hypothetical protein